jgi:hypothetical protein
MLKDPTLHMRVGADTVMSTNVSVKRDLREENRMRIHRLMFASAVVLGMLVSVLAFAGVPAQAAVGRSEIGAFGPGGPGSGAFGNSQSIAVEQGTEDVFVYAVGNGGHVYKFNAEGGTG